MPAPKKITKATIKKAIRETGVDLPLSSLETGWYRGNLTRADIENPETLQAAHARYLDRYRALAVWLAANGYDVRGLSVGASSMLVNFDWRNSGWAQHYTVTRADELLH